MSMQYQPPRPPQPSRSSSTSAPLGMTLVVAAVALMLSVYSLYPSQSTGEHGVSAVFAGAPIESGEGAKVESRPTQLQPARRAVAAASVLAAEEPPEPVRLHCRVLDEDGRGVPQAEVWVEDGSYALRGHTDQQGALTLELDPVAVADLWASGAQVLVGARHPAHGPSLLRAWNGPEEEELTLRLRGRGAALRLRLVDSAGLPIGGAAVHVSPDQSARFSALGHDGLPARITPGPALLTDGWGEVSFAGLEPGAAHVSLSSRGFVSRSVSLQLVEGALVERSLTLARAASVQGRLSCLDGKAAAFARVLAVGADDDALAETQTDSRGDYVLSEVPAGTVRLRAELRASGQLSQAATAEVLLRAGVTTTWDATLMPIDSLRGKLTDAAGLPLAGWRLELLRGDAEHEPLHIARTDEAGRYELPLPDTSLAARLLLYHPLSMGGIPTRSRSDLDELGDIQLEPGEERSSPLRGRLRRPDGRPAGLVPFVLHRLGTGHHLSLLSSADGGSFETPPLPPGDYVLLFPTHGRDWLPNARYEVGPTELVDIGTIRLPELGLVELLPSVPTRSAECRELRLSLHRPEVGADFLYVVHEGRTDLPVSLALAPGEYSLQLLDSMPPERIEFTVVSSGTTQLIVPGDL